MNDLHTVLTKHLLTTNFRICLCVLLILTIDSISLLAQQPSYTPASERQKAYEQRQQLASTSLLNEIKFRSAGPTVFSGRVTDVAVKPDDPTTFYVAYASGGLWKTENNGVTFSPIFDQEAVMTIGDIAVDWQRNIIYVGTGENNSSRSSYSGIGIYKSTDDGKNWQYLGLPESHHIGRILLDDENPDIINVAVLGHLYSPNRERGIFRSADGGKSWQHTLFVNENAGAIDIVSDPQQSSTLYAAIWQRERRAWNFTESGNGSGIYKSTDGGKSWKLMSAAKSGFPHGEGVGRIGLATAVKDGKTLVFAVVDNYFRRPDEKKDEAELLTKNELRDMTKDDFVKLDVKKVKYFLEENSFPEKYKPEMVMAMVKEDKIKPVSLVEYLEDGNSLLFDTPVIGAEVYRSDDGGKSWVKTHKDFINNTFFSYGYYFGQIRISPHNPDKIYFMGVPVLRSDDGGKTFKSINSDNVHVDHHALWLNPDKPGHLILGNDGGINISYDDGENWIKCNSPAVGQFYYVAVDMDKPYNIYGGLQDNGVWVGPSNYKASDRWHSTGKYPYSFLLGGDGMQIAVDSRNNNTVYTGFQFGFYYRIDKNTGERKYITPRHELGERPLRWNWQSPIHLSSHHQDILYMGSNKVHRSFNQGNDFTTLSDDLTRGGMKGDVPFGTLTALHESPMRFGLLYTGSDDGLVHVSKDGGYSWQQITLGLPEDMWVSRVQASSYNEGTVYLALNGYRWDIFEPYLYVSEDYGANWQRIGTDLPMEPINVVKEDPVNENILYVGTDHGLYISLDRGKSFMQMGKDMPAVAVHDLVIHPRDKELVVATHGRSFYVADVSQLQQLSPETLEKVVHIFELEKQGYNRYWGDSFSQWSDTLEPNFNIPFYANASGNMTILVKLPDGTTLRQMHTAAKKGINYYEYDLSINEQAAKKMEKALNAKLEKDEEEIKIKAGKNGKYYLYKGKYLIELNKDGKRVKEELLIE